MEITQQELDKLVRQAVLVALKGDHKRAIDRVFQRAGVGSESSDRAEQVLTLAASVHKDVERLSALLTSVFGLRKSVANQLIDEARRQIAEDRDTALILADLTGRFPEPDASRAAVLVLNRAMRPAMRQPKRSLQSIGAIVLAIGLGVVGLSAVFEEPLGLIGVPVAFAGAVVLYKGIRG